RTAAERLVLTLTVLGMIASVVAFMEFEDARSEITQVIVPATVPRSSLYYAAHASQIILFMSAGLSALLSTDWRRIEPGYLARFMLFIGAAILMTARGYSFSALLSSELVDWTGPAPCVISLLVFVGANRRNWVVLSKAMVI